MTTALVLLYWTSLLVPGYAVARRFDPDGVRSGLPAALVLSFMAAAGLLGLVAIPCYIVGLPLAVFSGASIIFLAWGIRDLIVNRCGPEIARLLAAAMGLELAVVLFDLIVSARVGAILGADAIVHVSRIRFLAEHGLLNIDHFVAERYFYPIYHTNLLHAFMASATQLTRLDAIEVWYQSLIFAKVLVVSGAWFAGWSIFRSAPAGWMTALFMLGARGPVTFTLYPNQMAPWFLVPVLIGFIVRAFVDGPNRCNIVAIAVIMMVTGMTHNMYVVFIMISIAPIVIGWALLRARRPGPDRRPALLLAGAILIGAPFPLVTVIAMKNATEIRLARSADRDQGDVATSTADSEEAKGEKKNKGKGKGKGNKQDIQTTNRIKNFDNGWSMHRIGRGFTGSRYVRVPIIIMSCALMVIAGFRREMWTLLGILLAVAAWLHIPPLFTVLLKSGGAEWIVHRFGTFQDVVFALMLPGSIIAIAEHAQRRATNPNGAAFMWLRWGLGGVCLFAGARFASQRPPYDWPRYLEQARLPEGVRTARALRPMLRFAEDLREHIPTDSVVLADPSIGTRVAMAHDCNILASTRSSVGVPDLGPRERAIKKILRGRTDEAERWDLIREWDITYAVVPRPVNRWMYDQMSEFWTTEYGWGIVKLRRPDEPPAPVLGDYDVALLDVGRFEEAIPRLQQRAVRQPEHYGVRLRLGSTLKKLGRYEEALVAFREAQAVAPDDPRSTIMIGNTYADLGDLSSAINAYHETLEAAQRAGRKGAQASAWFNIGNMYLRLADWEEAMTAYETALSINPSHAGAQQWRAEAWIRSQEGATSAAITPGTEEIPDATAPVDPPDDDTAADDEDDAAIPE